MKTVNIEKVLQNNTITLARAFLALSTLLTLIFTPLDDLFPLHHLIKQKDNINGILGYNIFLMFDNTIIPYIISIIVLILVILGVYPRILSFFHALVAYSFFYAALIVEGGDQINAILTFLLIPICILDTRIIAWKNNNNISIKKNLFSVNAKYSILFIAIQMSILYLNAGISKMNHTEWSNGTAIYYWFFDDMFGRPNWESLGFLFKNNISVSLISWSVIILEIFLFLGLFLKQKYKYILFLIGFLFHFLIVIIHGLPTFWLAMTGGLILYYFNLDKNVSENLKNLKLLLTIKSKL